METILIVGGGFLGSELAAGLAHRGRPGATVVYFVKNQAPHTSIFGEELGTSH